LFQELVAATPSQRNWKGILIALLVICAVLGLIIFSIYLLLPPDEGPRVKGRKVEINDIIGTEFIAPPFNGTWISSKFLTFALHVNPTSISALDSVNDTEWLVNSLLDWEKVKSVNKRK
jgi:hypothetical protein